jgi:outer membrane receptor for ferrienterochelin and colicins
MKYLFLFILLIGATLVCHAKQDQEGSHPMTEGGQEEGLDSMYYLNDVVVTGTRTPKLLKDTPIQTRLITSADIEKVDATNAEDLLQQEMPGVEFSYAMNQLKHMNLCGFGGQGILFLVDGERLAGETMDDVDFTRLNMANVERIEIVKGAASALYGSNAGGGVINIMSV